MVFLSNKMEREIPDVNVVTKRREMIGASFKGSEYTIYFSPYLEFNKAPIIALDYLTTYNSIHNVKNCSIIFSINGLPNKTINIPNGAYEITQINDYIEKELDKIIINSKNVFSIQPQNTTGKSQINIASPIMQVTLSDNLRKILGFNNNTLTNAVNISDNFVNILSVNIINVEVSIIEGSTINGIKKPVIYSFFPDVQFGFKINKEINNPFFLPTSNKTISRINIKLTDQDGKLIENNNETVDLRFLLYES